MKSIHHSKVLKEVVNRMLDTLPSRDREIVIADTDRITDVAKWFDSTVAAEAKAKFESPHFPMNDENSFRYPQNILPPNWRN